MRPLAALALVFAVAAILRLDPDAEDLARYAGGLTALTRAATTHARAWMSTPGEAPQALAANAARPLVIEINAAHCRAAQRGATERIATRRFTLLQRGAACPAPASGSVGSPNTMNFIPWKKTDAGYQSSFGLMLASPSRS